MTNAHDTKNTHDRTRVWPILSYRDARAGIAFLTDAFGFQPGAAYARDDDPRIVEHAEMRWPGGGGIMLGTAGKTRWWGFGSAGRMAFSSSWICGWITSVSARLLLVVSARRRIFAGNTSRSTSPHDNAASSDRRSPLQTANR